MTQQTPMISGFDPMMTANIPPEQLEQPTTSPQSEWQKAFSQTEAVITEEFNKIDQMVETGGLSLRMGAELKNYVIKKAFEKSTQQQADSAAAPEASAVPPAISAFDAHDPEFFADNRRKTLKDYLCKECAGLGFEELIKVTELVKSLETEALERAKQQLIELQSAKPEDDELKTRLSSLSTTSSGSENAFTKTFTRSEIAKMNSTEFLKHEKEIMRQMQQGKLK